MSVTIKIFADCDETDIVQSSETAVPISGVMAFAAQTPPDGWLVCDGSAISRTEYADLFDKIGTVWGAGDEVTTFNLPDLRGEFVRGFDDGRGVDDGRVFGSLQTDEFKNHTHGVLTRDGVGAEPGGMPLGWMNSGSESQGAPFPDAALSTGGDETRPRNIAMTYAIKAFYPSAS